MMPAASEKNHPIRVAILIPSRFNSSRFPGKAMHELGCTPMAKIVYDKCKSTGIDTFLISDDDRICKLVECSRLTSASCENGTARCAEAAQTLDTYDAFINVQGDMPDITVEIINKVASALEKNSLVTVYTKMSSAERLNPNSVKMIHNGSHAIWMCRAPLSYGDQHLGVYGYSKEMLSTYASLPKCDSEDIEGLEQLRWLNARVQMSIIHVDFNGIEINSPEDAQKWEQVQKSKIEME